MSESREGRGHPLKKWWRLSTAEVGEGPCSITKHGNFLVFVHACEKRLECAVGKYEVTTLGGVTGNVTKCPNSLLADLLRRA